MSLPYNTLTPFLGDNAIEYIPEYETTLEFMNGKFAELLMNDKDLDNKINVLSLKETKILYVDKEQGLDTNNGLTTSTPLKTIQKAINSIPKLLYANVTIRVKIGDYTSQGTISINNFTSGKLKIVAWNGTAEVETASSDLKTSNITCYYNKFLDLCGIEVVNTNATGYGVFLECCDRVRLFGYTNIDSTATTNSGVGITQGSNVYIENCVMSNRSACISCNFGSTITTKNFSGTNNDTVYSIHGGSYAYMFDDTSPAYNVSLYSQVEGGSLYDKSGNKLFANSKQRVFASRDLSIDGDWTIPISLSSKPSTIQAIACVSGTKVGCSSQYVNSSTFCTSTNANGDYTLSYNFIYLNPAGGGVNFTIKSISKDSVVLSCTKSSSPTGTISLSMIVQV